MTNEIKTILFASMFTILLALPPGISDSFADKPTTSTYNISDEIDALIVEFNTLEETRQELKQEIRETNPDKANKVKKLQKSLDAVTEQMDEIEAEAEALALVETVYAPSVTNPSVGLSSITEGDTIYAGSTHNACDSGAIPSSTNAADGDININSDTIAWAWDIADAKSVGWFWPFCTNVYFEEIEFITRNNTKGLNCSTVSDNVTSSTYLVQPCNCGIEDGDLLSWAVQTTYEPLSGTNTEGNDDWRGLHRVA